MKKVEELLKDPKNTNAANRLNKMKRLGVFIRNYNMTHLLATR
jgi:hypothetical protein